MQNYMKNRSAISILCIALGICVGCKTGGGDIRRIPAPQTGSEANKIFKEIAGESYTAANISCGSYVLKNVALKFSKPERRRLFERNKPEDSSTNVSLTYDDSGRIHYLLVNNKLSLTEEETIGVSKDVLAWIKGNMVSQKDPNAAPGEDDYAEKAQKAYVKMIEEGLTKGRVTNPAILQQKVRYSASSVATAEDTKAKTISFQAQLKSAGNTGNPDITVNALMDTGKKDTLAVELETPDGTCTGELIASGLSISSSPATLPIQTTPGY